MNLEDFKSKSVSQSAENRKFLQKLKRKTPKGLDQRFHKLHEEVFSEINCLDCANCCKTTSPIFYSNDIERASNALKIKPGEFMTTYLKVDADGDYVLKSAPCPFLDANNYCQIYASRPKACKEYPHTDRKKMVQILDLTYRNTLVCPAVLEIVYRMKEA